MTTYRVGQRVRIEWPDGTAVEGYLQKDACVVKYANRHYYSDIVVAERDGATITVLAEPEPQGMGAIVEAQLNANGPRRRWMRDFDGTWTEEFTATPAKWAHLTNQVILAEGWTP